MKLSPHFVLSELLVTDHTEYKLLQEKGVEPYITTTDGKSFTQV